MKLRLLGFTSILAIGVCCTPLQAQESPAPSTATPAAGMPVQNAPSAARQQADKLVAQMTLDEKISLVHGLFPPLANGKTTHELIPSAGHIDGIPRLGIPLVRETDASLGVANQVNQRPGDVATAMPSGLAQASSFDPQIAHEGGAMIGSEARAKRFNVMLAGGVNLTRDPWGGRNFEYLGEDPLLAGDMAGAQIAGVQSNKIVSTVKHLALNSQETGRFQADAIIGDAAMRMSDLLAFQIAIEKGNPGSVMCAYNQVNGTYSCQNDYLLNKVLKHDWGYQGWVMSDWGAVHSTVQAANNGLDQESGEELDKQIFFGAPLKAAVEAGKVPMARLDDMVARYLTGLIESGAFDTPAPETVQKIDYSAHAKVAQKAAEAGIVLLKNEGDLLPFASNAKRIAVIGGHADVGVLSGGGSSQVRSVGGVPIEVPIGTGPAASFVRITYHDSSPLKALRKAMPNATITFTDQRDVAGARKAAAEADIAIVFAPQWTSEAIDAPNLDLPYHGDALIDAVVSANPKTVVVLETSGPVLMPWIDKVPAVVEAWYPGQRGGEAIANVLTGKVNPSGHLPITFPRSAEQAPRPEPVDYARIQALDAKATADPENAAKYQPPIFPIHYIEGANVGYRWYELKGEKPLFPFGYGLSYTSFAYAHPQVTGGKTLTVSFDVTNTGGRAGSDVAQVYVTRKGSGEPMRLAAFQRLSLKPGETRRVTLTAEPRIVADYDTSLPGWRIADGTYQIAIAHDAEDRAMVVETQLDPATMRP
ncbi:glycosyl hydrolase [Porphyrobacter algicida]|uniref:Glycosyl hydrolase n=1 Tax=Qipengyuania algicida TaxID=1836209 RepID=A0A845AED0_9SPHN|nr:beta-glucosidase [Qipengyuania algicida]MXP27759.1 glycosyl hydrolase [Qipengyuania algicida]